MLNVLLRLVLFIGGIALLVDAGIPPIRESLLVDLHSIETERESGSGKYPRTETKTYTLHFRGGRLSTCSVKYSTYVKLKDGDAVDVQFSKLFKHCIRISKDGQMVENYKYWKLISFLGGCLLIAVAFGAIKSDEDDQCTHAH